MNNELKSCPFCGGKDLDIWDGGMFRPLQRVVHCNTCHMETSPGTDRRWPVEELIAAWNKRAKEEI